MTALAGLTRRIVLSATLGAALTPGLARADAWPTRPVTLIVPFGAGTSSDIIARSLAKHLTLALGQPFVIDNRAGAGGNIGAAAAAHATADGYTLLFATTGPAATNKLMYKNMPFDPQRSFAPIALIGKSPVIIVAKKNAPFSTLKELVAYAKAHPGELTVGVPGNGTLGHVTAELLQKEAGITLNKAPYGASPPIITDLAGEHIDLGMDSSAPYIAPVQDGLIKGIAVASAERIAKLPNTPSTVEAGMPELNASVWYALLAPAGAPDDIVKKLNSASNDYVKSDEARAFFESLAILPAGGTPDDLKTFTQSELDKWAPIVKAANISF